MPRVSRTTASSGTFTVDVDPYDFEQMCTLVTHSPGCPSEHDRGTWRQRMEVHNDRVPSKAVRDQDVVGLVERGYDVRAARCIDCAEQVIVDMRG